ncbi:hypothetical protein UY3_13276 [Chelonia mydas]|uniref:Uncharacterized protein n=1 Tax=Chelonia mydas TaxID=8469 RepID=M7BBU0_CHEMY|nr:hypothetical protein UY3_13276 [Chelonia mydas]
MSKMLVPIFTALLYFSTGNNFVFAKMGCVSNCQDYVVGPYNWHIFHCCTKDFCNA